MLNQTRDGVSWRSDSVIGGQVNITFSEQWDAVGQVVVQDRADRRLDNYIEKAFVRYRPARSWAMRGGRLDSNFYMLSDYRPAGYAYTWARPPLDFYSAVAVAAVTDGADLQYTTDWQEGVVKLGVLYGNSAAHLASEDGTKTNFDFANLLSFTLEYQRHNWQFKATSASATLKNFEYADFNEFVSQIRAVPAVLWPQAQNVADYLDPAGDKAEFAAIGVKFDDSQWQIQSELASFKANWQNLPDAKFGYLSIGYYLDDVLPYFLVSAHRPDNKYTAITAPALPPGVPANIVQSIQLLAHTTEDAAANSFIDQNSVSLGIRWDFADAWALKAQFDHIRMQAPGSALFGNNSLDLKIKPKPLNVLHLGLSTVF
ncbi:hypothetical protein P2G88_05660 [Aliiglaciecola sp. CAU 1673]|uniref:hypothetical protein n=1 Tax=Aliiglaciecola sp. CAU 1673 TaxID=3032595 RepID=UPI0023DA9176|nr:hypothetical protein [Aliiglaciecola sp. CAU 1673]MDF2177730.1 hypothetical protein [Aliiglaciecola sp. CAU 1673]